MIPVHIMLHGLIALVPLNDAGGANHITALLVDARQAPPGVQIDCFAPHLPVVRVTTQTTAECSAAGCSPSGLICICDLSRQEVSIQPDVQPLKQQLAKRPPSSLPFGDVEAGDFSYVANLAQPPLNQPLDSRFLEDVPPDALVARMTFPFESLSACALGTRPDETGNNVHPLSFRQLHDLEKQSELSQALAQQVGVRFSVPDDTPVTLKITDFGGGNPRTLTLKPGTHGYMIELLNERASLLPDDPCDDGVGRDFAFFYELVREDLKPDWVERPVPHVKYTRWKSARDLETPECGPFKAPSSRPICAMVSFNP